MVVVAVAAVNCEERGILIAVRGLTAFGGGGCNGGVLSPLALSQAITEFCVYVGAPSKTRGLLIRKAKTNGDKLGFLV